MGMRADTASHASKPKRKPASGTRTRKPGKANPLPALQTWYAALPQTVKLGLLVAGAVAFTLGGIAVGTSLINRGPDPARAKQQPTYPKFDQPRQSSSSGEDGQQSQSTLAEGAKPPILGASAEISGAGLPDDDPIDLPGTQNLTWDPARKRLTFDVTTDIPKLGVQEQRIQLRRLALQWLDNAFVAEPDAAEAVVNLVSGSPKMTLVTLGATRSQIDAARSAELPADSAVSIETWSMQFKS